MGDYPDYTDIMQIIGSDIMIPIDLQAAYIMMPVDIQAQYLTLEIDIKAQSIGNLDVNIAAADIGNIGIDIKANTLGNLTIDIEAQSIGVLLYPDWQAVQDADKDEVGYATCNDATYTRVLDYTVTAYKTFYICQWGFNVDGNTGVLARLEYQHNTTYKSLAFSGGQVGNSHNFPKPIKVVAGDHIRIGLVQYSGGSITGYGCVSGYEI